LKVLLSTGRDNKIYKRNWWESIQNYRPLGGSGRGRTVRTVKGILRPVKAINWIIREDKKKSL
jgi:hypothetical protein